MPNDRPGNRRPADEARRVASTGSADQSTLEAFQNSIQSVADKLQAQGLGPELESAFSQIFDKVFDSILKSFSASSQRVLGGTAAASTGGGGPVTMGGAASHGIYAPSVTSSASYALVGRNQIAPTTVATGGISATRTLAGLPLGNTVGQTGITSSASIYGLPPAAAGVAQVGYSGGSAVISGAAQMAASAPGMPSYASSLAPLGTSAAGLPATAPSLTTATPGLPSFAGPPQTSISLFPGAQSLNYLQTQQQIAAQNAPASRWQNFRSMMGNRFGGGGGAASGVGGGGGRGLGSLGGNVLASLGMAGARGMMQSWENMQEDTINANMLQTSLGGFNQTGLSANDFFNTFMNQSGANKYGYTGTQMIQAGQSYMPMTGGVGTVADVNRMAAFGSGTGLGLQQTAQFMGGLGQAGWIGPRMAGGQGYVPMSRMVASGMAASQGAGIGVNRADWEQGLYTLAQQQTAATLTTNTQQQRDLTRQYVAFNASGSPGLRGTQGAQLMGQITQGVANFQSSPYTTQQMYAALGSATGGNLTPAMVGLITSTGPFVQQPGLLPKGQTVYGDIMRYAKNQWGSLGKVAESYQLAPMLGISQSQAFGILNSRMGQGNLDQNMNDVTKLARQSHINLSTQQGQQAIATIGDIAWTLHGKNSKDIRNRISTVRGEMESQGYTFDDKKFNHMTIKQQQSYMMDRVKGGATSEADKTRQAMTSLQRTLEKLDHDFIKTGNDFQAMTSGFGPVVGVAVAGALSSALPGILSRLVRGGSGGGAVGNFLGSALGGGARLVGTGATAAAGTGAAAVAGATAGGLALGAVVGKAITMGTDEASWMKYGDSIKAFLSSPAGKGFGVKSDLFGGLVVTDDKTTIPVKSWGEVHQRMLGKEKHYILQTTGNWFSHGQSLDIGAATATAATASTNAAATITRQHSARSAGAPGGSTTTGASGAGPVQANFDQVNLYIPENAIATLVNGQYKFQGTAGVTVTSRNPKNGGNAGSGRPTNNRQGPGPS